MDVDVYTIRDGLNRGIFLFWILAMQQIWIKAIYELNLMISRDGSGLWFSYKK